MTPVAASVATAVSTWKAPTNTKSSPTNPEVPGRPTFASVNTMNTRA